MLDVAPYWRKLVAMSSSGGGGHDTADIEDGLREQRKHL